MKIFNVLPQAFPARHIIVIVELNSKKAVHLFFSGNAKTFRVDFIPAGFKIATVQEDHEVSLEYFRVK